MFLRYIIVDESNIHSRTGFIIPENPPFNKGAFRIEINFPAEYPFKPPKISFKSKIYHPNIDEKGQVRVCLPIIRNKCCQSSAFAHQRHVCGKKYSTKQDMDRPM